jgi:hypothetical protein
MEQPNKPSNEECALTVLTQWRRADCAALADRQSRDAQRFEYKMRNCLRDAADKLKGEP